MVGAIFSGVSAVIAVLLVVRKTMNLQYFLRREHFDALAKLVLIFSLSWTYFFFNDYLVEWYGGEWVGHQLLTFQARGPIAPFWYAMLFFNIVIPAATLWNKRVRRSPMALFLIAIGIQIGMYLERFLIIPGFLQRNACRSTGANTTRGDLRSSSRWARWRSSACSTSWPPGSSR